MLWDLQNTFSACTQPVKSVLMPIHNLSILVEHLQYSGQKSSMKKNFYLVEIYILIDRQIDINK